MKAQHGEGNWAHNPTPVIGANGHCQLLGKEETVRYECVVPCKSNMLNWNILAAQMGLEDFKEAKRSGQRMGVNLRLGGR